jgi:hypothetical protein
MKKVLVLFAAFLFLFPDVNAQFVRKWEKSSALGNLPSWFSTTAASERGIAYHEKNGLSRLFVISNNPNPAVIILNALTGDSVGTLNMTGITGPLNDISTEGSYPGDTKIYACNYTADPSTSSFKIYRWEDETSVPELIAVDYFSDFPLGNQLSVNYGGWTNSTRLIVPASNTNKIIEYVSYYSSQSFTRKEIQLSDTNMGNNASADYNWVYPYTSNSFGGYFVNSDGHRPKAYDTLGTLINISNDTLISSSNNSLKYFANGTLSFDVPFYTTFNYSNNKAELVLSSGYFWESYWGSTPSLGNNPNPTNYGDISFIWRTYDSLLVFVLAGNNGIGAYHANGLWLPVELISFTASQQNNSVLLSWTTATESNNNGFEIQKKTSDDQWINISFVEGKGTTTELTNYNFIDNDIIYGKIFYRLKQIDYDGTFDYSEIISVETTPPVEYALMQNYPNPFNPSTVISFSIPEEVFVNLSVYNLLGERIKELKNEVMLQGVYQSVFDASGLTSGIYFYHLNAGKYSQTKKMILLQ